MSIMHVDLYVGYSMSCYVYLLGDLLERWHVWSRMSLLHGIKGRQEPREDPTELLQSAAVEAFSTDSSTVPAFSILFDSFYVGLRPMKCSHHRKQGHFGMEQPGLRIEAGEQLARRYFQWPRLRSFQRRALEAWAAQRPCLVLSATGSGKSGCFALPALVERHWRPELPAAALVVSPLVALMHDQADRLRLRGLGAVVCSPQGGLDFQTALQAVHGGALVVFMAPETAVREASRKTLRQLRVALVAIDEAEKPSL